MKATAYTTRIDGRQSLDIICEVCHGDPELEIAKHYAGCPAAPASAIDHGEVERARYPNSYGVRPDLAVLICSLCGTEIETETIED